MKKNKPDQTATVFRQKAEDEFSETIINKLPGIFYLYDEAGKFIKWNKNFELLTGYTGNEISGMHPLDFYDADQQEIIKNRIKNVFKKDRPGIEVELLSKQKNKIPFYINSKVVTYKGKKCLMGTGIDITERKQAEKKLVEKDQQLREISSSIPGFIYQFKMDAGGKFSFTFVSENIKLLAGLSPKKIYENAENAFAKVHPDDLPGLYSSIYTSASTLTPWLYIFRVVQADKTFKWIRANSIPKRQEDGCIVWDGAMFDITDRKQAEDALALHNEALLKINQFSFKLSMVSSGDNLESIIARGFKEIAGAEVSIFSGYDPVNRTLTPKHIEMEPGLLKKVVSIIGKKLNNIHSVVSDELYLEMTRDLIGMRKTLHEVSFGAIPQPVGALIQALLKVDRFIAVAHVIDGKLYGTSLLAIKKGQPDPPREILENFSLLASVSLRRKRAEEELEQSEKKYRLLTDKASDTVWLMDLTGKSTFVSPAIEKFTGYTIDEYLNQTIDDRFTPASALKAKNKLSEELKKYGVRKKMCKDYFISMILDYRCKDGSVKTGEILITPYFNEKNELSGLHGVTRDITERMKAEEKLFEREVQYRTLFENAQVGIYCTTPDGDILTANPALVKMLGYPSLDELIKRNLEKEGFEPDYQRKDFKELMERKGEITGFEAKWKRFNGTVIFVNENAKAIRGENGQIMYYEGTVEDITERKLAEEKLSDSEARYRLLIESSSEGILIAQDNHLKFVNPRILEKTGYTEKELLAIPFIEFIHPDFRELIINNYKKRMRDEQVDTNTRIKIINKDKSTGWVQLNGVKIEWEGKPAVMNFCSDISGLKKQEEEIKASELRYRTLIEQAQDAIFISKPDGIYADVNTSGCKLLGYSREEFLNLTVLDLIFKEDLEKNPVRFDDMRAGKTIHYERRMKRKDGTALEVEVTGKKLTDGRNLIFLRDITERRHFEENLLASELRYRRLFEAAKDGILILDAATGAINDVNPFLMELIGYSKNHFIGKQLWEIGLFKDILANKSAFLKLQEEGYIRYDNLQLKTNDGHPIYVEFVSNVYHVNGNKVVQCNIRNITERKHAEDALQESEDKFRDLVENISDLICTHDIEGRIISVNPAAMKLLGYDQGTLLNMKIQDILVPEIKNQYPGYIASILKEGYANGFMKVRTAAGVERIWEFSNSLRSIGVETPIVRGFAKDITERKQVEEALRNASSYNRRLIEASIDPLVTIGQDGKITDVNSSTEQVTGCNRDELIGTDFSDYFTEPDQAKAGYQQVFINGSVHDYPLSIRHTSGKITDVLYNATVYKNEDGKIQGVFAAAHDITKRKQALEALELSESRYKTLFEKASDGILIINDKGKILNLNESFAKMHGYTVDEMLSMNLRELDTPEMAKILPQRMDIVMAGKTLNTETDHIHKDGHIVSFSISSSLIKVGNQSYIQAFHTDISERKKAELLIKEKVLELESANKDLEQFAHIASHDLQEPLRMISSYTQLLEREYKDKLAPDANEYIHFVVDGASRMKKLIQDLLDFSRIGTRERELEQVDTSITLRKVIANLQLLIDDNTAVITHDNLPVLKADESQLLRLFQNLIENAIKFRKKTELPKIHISCKKKNNMYEFSVSDNGIGIDMKYHDRVFIIFQRLHSAKEYPGTGIGLSINKRIVERHGGKIWFESKENKGTTFYFTIHE